MTERFGVRFQLWIFFFLMRTYLSDELFWGNCTQIKVFKRVKRALTALTTMLIQIKVFKRVKRALAALTAILIQLKLV